jgi:peptidyl-prolyl cis-trans isomerase D
MQIIQSIKERGSVIMAIFIAIALISFILMDSNSGSNNGSLTGKNSVGSINGNKIDITEFEKRFKQEETKQAQQRGGQPLGGADALRVRDQVWNQIVAENVFYKEAEKLGINLTPKELSAILLSNDQANPFMQERTLLGADGKLDVQKASEALTNIKKFTGEQRDNIDAQILEPLKLSTAAAKYSALITSAAYYPTWMQEKDGKEEKEFAVISLATVPFSDISDSSITVTDAEINNYVAKHKDLFKQEAGRTISYLTFSQNPSSADSAVVKNDLEGLKAAFATDSSAKGFVARNMSVVDFQDEFLPLSRISSAVKDSIVKQPIGVVTGPYVDGANYSIAKIIGTKQLPDSVKARHILIGTRDQQSGTELMADSAAKKLADSILLAVKGGANFAELATKYSTDPGSKIKGGDLGNFGYGQMVPEFNEFCFTKAVGSKDVVKTQFGYHVIDVTSQSNFKPAYKIAFVAKAIVPSDETINAANLAATKAAANKTGKDLIEYAKKAGLNIVENPTVIKENEFTVGNMQEARTLVKWLFDAKQGAVSDPIPVGRDFVVATVNKTFAEGVQDAATARSGAEVIIKKEKKTAQILEKLGANPTFETVAAKFNKQPQTFGADSTITFSSKILNGIGVEPKVIGAAFNKENQTKVSAPIEGTTGVYLLKVNSLLPKAEKTAEQAASFIASRQAAQKQSANGWFEALRKQATIKDTRSKYY